MRGGLRLAFRHANHFGRIHAHCFIVYCIVNQGKELTVLSMDRMDFCN
jgi:hypothetical protein